MAIKTIVSVKAFMRNFLVTFPKCSMLTFIVAEPVAKFGFYFPNVGKFTNVYILNVSSFFEYSAVTEWDMPTCSIKTFKDFSLSRK